MDQPMTFQAARMPPPPRSGEAGRRDLRTRLAAGFRLLGERELGIGVAGHMSGRDPVHPDHFWVNPFGAAYRTMRPQELSLVRHDGTLVEGEPINAAAFAIHREIHRARADVVCVVHGHPVYGTAWAALGRTLDPINQDVCAFYEDHVVFDEPTGVVVETSEGAQIAAVLGATKAAVLRNHGLLTVGRTVDEALWWFVLMERCCRIQLLAEAAGTPTRIPAAQARSIARQIGTPAFGWFQCQPLLAPLLSELKPD
jgi:ribulose-5-phosphate 4-epimerase/fuculose-1-phosphate aldolase